MQSWQIKPYVLERDEGRSLEPWAAEMLAKAGTEEPLASSSLEKSSAFSLEEKGQRHAWWNLAQRERRGE